MRNNHFAIFLLMLFALDIAAAEPLATPQSVRLTAEKQLAKCTKSVAQHTPVGNQLITDGLNSCYAQAKSLITTNIENAAKKIAQSQDTTCHKLHADLEEKWAAYNEDLANLPSIGDAPLNTSDDLDIAMLVHRYDLAYTIAGNPVCN